MEPAKRRPGWVSGCLFFFFFSTMPQTALARTTPGQEVEPAVRPQIAKSGGPTYPREEAFIRDVYARLMRYQLAAVEFHGITSGVAGGVQDYLVIQVGNIQTRDGVAPVSAKQGSDPGGGLTLKRTALCHEDDPCHAYYEVEWAAQTTAPAPADRGFEGTVVRHTSYEVRVALGGREATYSGLVLFHETGDSSKLAPEVVDPVIPQINEVANERSPLAIAPWSKYIKTGKYYAVVARVKGRITAGETLVDPSAPIGFIPGDDVTREEALLASMLKGRSGDCDCGDCRRYDGTHCVPETYPPEPPNLSGCCHGQRYNSQTSCCIKSAAVQDKHPANGDPTTCEVTFQNPDWSYEYDGCTSWSDNPAGGKDTSFHNPLCSSVSPSDCTGPCDVHDTCYQTCEPMRGHGFCDILLRDLALQVCNNSQEPLVVRLYCQDRALEMYFGLLAVGELAFSARQREVCQCCP